MVKNDSERITFILTYFSIYIYILHLPCPHTIFSCGQIHQALTQELLHPPSFENTLFWDFVAAAAPTLR